MDNKIKTAGKNKSQMGPSNYEIANELPLTEEEIKKMSANPGKIGKTGKKLKGFNGRDNIIKGESKDDDPDRTVPYNTYNTLKGQYYTALKDAEHYKRLWETAYTDPEKIKLWSCIKHKLFGFSNGYNMFRGLFGHFSIWNINNHRDSYPWNNRPTMKTRWIFHYLAPGFMSKYLESIDFYNIYDVSETGEKVTEFVIAGTENLYILYLRKKKDYWGKGDWHWCLKFEKRENDHCGSC